MIPHWIDSGSSTQGGQNMPGHNKGVGVLLKYKLLGG